MRHRKSGRKLGRNSQHRKAMLSALVCGLIERKRIVTTLEKAKETRSVAEKMVTKARPATLAARRYLISALNSERHADILIKDIAPQYAERKGGYTRIVKLGDRLGDGAQTALLEWVGIAPPEKKTKKKTAAGKS